MLNKVNLYSLGIIVNSKDLKNGSYGIVIEDFYPVYYIIENPGYAYELAEESSNWEKWGKTNFFKINTVKGRVFEKLVSSKIKNTPPFSILYKDYTHLTQIHLKGVDKQIIADDLFVKEVRDNRGRPYFRAVISDSKLNIGTAWTPNQKSELINVFKNTTDDYITFTVKSREDVLRRFNLPKNFKTNIKVRIYKEDLYKIISDGNDNLGKVLDYKEILK